MKSNTTDQTWKQVPPDLAQILPPKVLEAVRLDVSGMRDSVQVANYFQDVRDYLDQKSEVAAAKKEQAKENSPGHVAGVVARTGLNALGAVADTPSMMANLAGMGIGALTGRPVEPIPNYGGQAATWVGDQLGLPQPTQGEQMGSNMLQMGAEGAALGAFGGPAGAVAGGLAGLAQGGAMALSERMGLNPLGQLAAGVVAGIGTGAGVNQLSKLGTALTQQGRMVPLWQDFQDLGVSPGLQNVNPKGLWAQLMRKQQGMLGAGPELAAHADAMASDFGMATRRLAERAAPGVASRTGEGIGREVREGLLHGKAGTRSPMQQIEDAWDAAYSRTVYGNFKPPQARTAGVLVNSGAAQSNIEALMIPADTKRTIMAYINDWKEGTAGKLDANTMRAFQKFLLEKLVDSPEIIDNRSRQFFEDAYAAVSADLRDGLAAAAYKAGGGKRAGKIAQENADLALRAYDDAMAKAEQFTRDWRKVINPLLKDNQTGAELMAAVERSVTPEGAGRIATLMSHLPADTKRTVSGWILGRMGRANPQIADWMNEPWSPQNFIKHWNQMKPEGRQAMFGHLGKEWNDEVDKLARAADATAKSGTVYAHGGAGNLPYGAGPGGVGALYNNVATVGSAGLGYAMGGPLGAAGGAGLRLLWDAMAKPELARSMVKLSQNPRFIRWALMEYNKPSGFLPSTLPSALEALRKDAAEHGDDNAAGFAESAMEMVGYPTPFDQARVGPDTTLIPR